MLIVSYNFFLIFLMILFLLDDSRLKLNADKTEFLIIGRGMKKLILRMFSLEPLLN